MKKVHLIILVIISGRLYGQGDIKITSAEKPGGFVLSASNDAYCPMSVLLELNLENLEEGEGKRDIYIIPARTAQFKLLELNIKNPKKKSTFSSRVQFNMGDITLRKYDTEHAYQLPFRKGSTFVMFQGYNGKASHQNQKALDFTMPPGTEILASRGGVVVKVVEDNMKACPEESCKQYNNYVIIYHSDGTMAEYTHIKKGGAKVKVGDKVEAGHLIALSGNVGWTTGPHLHFVCFLPEMDSRNTVPTKFMVEDGKKVVFLEEKLAYTRNY